MGIHNISLVARKSGFENKEQKIREIVDWLIETDVIKSQKTDCILSDEPGYPISEGAKKVVLEPDWLPFDSSTNGLEIITTRSVFHSNIINVLICPSCNENIAEEDWDFFNEWASGESDNLTCPKCGIPKEIHLFKFDPAWGFSDLGFTFWEGHEFTQQFIRDFERKLGTEVDIVLAHL